MRGLRVVAAALAFLGLGLAPLHAQNADKPAGEYKQVKLDAKMVENFIAAQKDLADFAQKNPDSQSDKPDPKVQAQLDELAKKHGFANFAEFDDVGFNVSVVMSGLDPQTGNFTDPVSSLKTEIAEVTNDKSMAEKDKKQILDELNEALKNTPPLQYPENVEVVKKYREQIDKVLQ